MPFGAVAFPGWPVRAWFDELGFGEDGRQRFSQGDLQCLTFDLEEERKRFQALRFAQAGPDVLRIGLVSLVRMVHAVDAAHFREVVPWNCAC